MKEMIQLGPMIIVGKVPVMGKIYRTFILLFDNEVVGLLIGIVLYVVHISDLYSSAYGQCRSPYRF